MSQMSYEQENDGLDQLTHHRHNGLKMQTTEMRAKTQQVLATPMSKGLASLKTPFAQSSRKAFGNVSNVLHSAAKPSVTTKTQTKDQSVVNASEAVNSDINFQEKKPLAAEVDTNPAIDAKFCDEIENMYPMTEEMMSDMNEPVTDGLFGIDDQIIFGMPFDSDLPQGLAPNTKNFDFNRFL